MKINVDITSEFHGRSGLHTITVSDVEQYAIDNAIDTDADQWSVDIADPFAEFIDLFGRDNEIQVRLRSDSDETLLTGFCDVAIHQPNGTLSLAGRDLTAAAIDSFVLPFDSKNVRPALFIRNHAAVLGIKDTRLDSLPVVERLYSDGSETEWELWYRMARAAKRYLWSEPNGTLVMEKLNTYDPPSYNLGRTPIGGNPREWIPVEEAEFKKSNQGRLWRVYVYGVRNKVGFTGRSTDPAIGKWLKKPVKIISSTSAHTQARATQEAEDEVFDSKVGARELSITIPVVRPVIQQNRIARLNIPEKNLTGLWFIVGNRIQNGADGAIQQVRLREKGFALSRRVPHAPQLETQAEKNRRKTNPTTGDYGSSYDLWFARAAKDWTPAGIPVDLFNAVLHAICEIETNFSNVRAKVGENRHAPKVGKVSGNPWYPRPKIGTGILPPLTSVAEEVEQWKNDFANERENPRIGEEFAVGPMQLLTRSYKEWADTHANKSGEYDGGRWIPEHNIWAAARALVDKMQYPTPVPRTAAGLYEAVYRYGDGTRAYAQKVRQLVEDHYLADIKSDYDKSQATEKAERRNDPGDTKYEDLIRLPDDVDYYKKGILLQPNITPLAIAVARRFRTPLISGYRDEHHNEKAGGAKGSDHLCGGAGDFSDRPQDNQGTPSMHRLALWAEAERVKGNLAIVIYGHDKIGPSDWWDRHLNHVHISFYRCAHPIIHA